MDLRRDDTSVAAGLIPISVPRGKGCSTKRWLVLDGSAVTPTRNRNVQFSFWASRICLIRRSQWKAACAMRVPR